jgi:excisionase family DNA binding protein
MRETATSARKDAEFRHETGAPGDRFVDVRQAAALLHLSDVSIRRFLTQRKLRRYKVGHRTLLDRAEVLGLVQEVK